MTGQVVGDLRHGMWASEAVWRALVLSSRAEDRPPTLLHTSRDERRRDKPSPHHLSLKYSSPVLSEQSTGKKKMCLDKLDVKSSSQ